MTDAFLAARPEYRRAQVLAAKHLPLQAGEVAEFPKRRMFYVWMGLQLVVCALPVLLICAVL